MNQCFVIQPFDNDKFDKRYQDVYAPAILEGGYEPYRVDKDISTEIPIESIDSNIRSSSVVLADITMDNPNVWFEVGLAIAYKKRTILVCSDERKDKYPFDIQQHSIISYKTGSLSDFENLKSQIINKLKYFSSRTNSIAEKENNGQILSESLVSDEAFLLIGTIGQNILGQNDSIPISLCIEKFKECGYNQLAFNFALAELCELKFTEQGIGDYDCPECRITTEGFSWMRRNKSRFNLIAEEKIPREVDSTTENQNTFSENIPF